MKAKLYDSHAIVREIIDCNDVDHIEYSGEAGTGFIRVHMRDHSTILCDDFVFMLDNEAENGRTYISAEEIKAEIDKIIEGLKVSCSPNPMGTIEECLAAAEIETLELVKSSVDQLTRRVITPSVMNNVRK